MPLHVSTRFQRAFATFGAALALGCGGPTLADLGAQEVVLTLSGFSSEPEVAAVGEPAEGLGVSRALLRVSQLTFVACGADVEDVELPARAYDLLREPPPSEVVSTAVQELCGVRVELEPSDANAVEDVPEEATLYVEATDNEGNAFKFSSDAVTSLSFQTERGSSFGDQPLLLGIDLSVWLADLPLEAEQSEETSERFSAQLRDAAALFVDENDNGELDDDERTPLLTPE